MTATYFLNIAQDAYSAPAVKNGCAHLTFIAEGRIHSFTNRLFLTVRSIIQEMVNVYMNDKLTIHMLPQLSMTFIRLSVIVAQH